MFGNWHEWLWQMACLFLVGASIKLMDDFLDSEYDLCRGRRTLAAHFGRAVLPYAVLAAVSAAAIDVHLTIAVFLGSYVVGMFSTWRERLPTRLPSYVEMGICAGLSWLLVGWRLGLWGIAIMAAVDWLDDVVDCMADRRTGAANLVIRLGVAEVLLLTLIALCTAVFTEAMFTVSTFAALALLTLCAELSTQQLWQSNDDRRAM